MGKINTAHIPEEIEVDLHPGNAGNFWMLGNACSDGAMQDCGEDPPGLGPAPGHLETGWREEAVAGKFLRRRYD